MDIWWGNSPDLPATIRRLRPGYITVLDQDLYIVLHGGHDHYGYRLRQEPDAKQWILEWYKEDTGPEMLVTLP